MRWGGAFASVVFAALTPAIAAEQRIPDPPPLLYPQLVVSADGVWQNGRFDTGNPTTAHQFTARAYNVSLGARLGEHLLIALRGQESWTDVNLTLVPTQIHVHSQSYGVRTVVTFSPVVWDTTASAAIDNNSIFIPDPTGFIGPMAGVWHGREWALDSSLSARLAVGFLVFEPLGGVRVVKLHDEGFMTGGVFPVVVPPQNRSDTSYRAQGTVSAPIRLDQYGTLTPWVAGEYRRSNNPHPPIGSLTDLTGMAGGHYIFNLPFLESPGPFPHQVWRTASLGLRLDVSPSFTWAATGVWSRNDVGHWFGYRVNATIRF